MGITYQKKTQVQPNTYNVHKNASHNLKNIYLRVVGAHPLVWYYVNMLMTFKNLHILIVEDIDPMRALMKQCLTMLGVGKISTAKNGEEGYEAYLRGKPDIIITDWEMPGMNGLELTQKIRRAKQSPRKETPIIMMTGFCAKERITQSLDSGVNSFIVKPFSASDLAKRLAHIVNHPTDFIITASYSGPERDTHKENLNKEDIIQTIKASNDLQTKVGTGTINKEVINRSQEVINQNKIDFVPIATHFVHQLFIATENMKTEQEPNRRSIERIISPIMQIKANARICHHELLGSFADIMLDFLEKINDVDPVIIQIVNANQLTLKHLISGKKKEELEQDGDNLQKELKSAFTRYMNIKYKISQNKLKKKTAAA
ncbi:MAG: hypothetical protein COA45_08365 [Zetaproteobacteria bacterium]|nr:MAG: hypothetical protein COA45_08365 [Zetaproteobacteria bacterium]